MKKILGAVRRADADFSLIRPGERVLVGVSGGKDSLLLLKALAVYRTFAPKPFELAAATLDLGLGNRDYSPIAALCQSLGVPYIVEATQIGSIVFEARREKHPCALCARMRRGALLDFCRREGFTTLALGHHLDDAIETLLLSLLYEGRFHTFQPLTVLSGLRQIRPLVYLSEGQCASAARRLDLPVVPALCPIAGSTHRQEVKDLLRALSRMHPDIRERFLSALKSPESNPFWMVDSEQPRIISGPSPLPEPAPKRQ